MTSPCDLATLASHGRRAALGLALAAAPLLPFAAQAQDKTIVMASTTSTEQSGLFAHQQQTVAAGTLGGAAFDARQVFVPITLGLATRFGLSERIWLRPALAVGVAVVVSQTRVGPQPWIEELGLGPAAQLSVQLGVRAVYGGPFVELRGLWGGTPRMVSLQGPLVSVLLMGGYALDVL